MLFLIPVESLGAIRKDKERRVKAARETAAKSAGRATLKRRSGQISPENALKCVVFNPSITQFATTSESRKGGGGSPLK